MLERASCQADNATCADLPDLPQDFNKLCSNPQCEHFLIAIECGRIKIRS